MTEIGERMSSVEARLLNTERDIVELVRVDREHDADDRRNFREIRDQITAEVGKLYGKLDEIKVEVAKERKERDGRTSVNQWGLIVALLGIIATLVTVLVKG